MTIDANSADADVLVRRAVYDTFAEGGIPSRVDVARRTGLEPGAVADSYRRLADGHVIVLDPSTQEVWMAMPFSAVPTCFRVESDIASWWANCAWDALGIAAALDRDVSIHSTCPDCRTPLTLTVHDGVASGPPVVAHFAVRAAEWWNDIGFT